MCSVVESSVAAAVEAVPGLALLGPGAVDRSRERLKPEIPRTGAHDIPLRDELELELALTRIEPRTGSGQTARSRTARGGSC